LQGNCRLGTTTVVYLTQNGLLASDSRDDFWGGRTSLLLPPGAENPSYATVHEWMVGVWQRDEQAQKMSDVGRVKQHLNDVRHELSIKHTQIVEHTKKHHDLQTRSAPRTCLTQWSRLRFSRVQRPTKHTTGHFGDGFLRVNQWPHITEW